MSYHTLAESCHAQIDIKKSQFLAFAYPVHSREQAMTYVEQLKQQYPDARHHCWAYIIGDPNNTTSAGFDDDGEPSGTAGKPILNVIQHKAIGNCIIIVVRYFGGIKLGAGGLTRAYSASAQAVVDTMILTDFIPQITATIETDFSHEAFIRHIVANLQGEIQQAQYEKSVILSITIAEKNLPKLLEKISIYGELTVLQ